MFKYPLARKNRTRCTIVVYTLVGTTWYTHNIYVLLYAYDGVCNMTDRPILTYSESGYESPSGKAKLPALLCTGVPSIQFISALRSVLSVFFITQWFAFPIGSSSMGLGGFNVSGIYLKELQHVNCY